LQNFVRQFHYVDDQRLPLIRGIGIGEGSSTYHWDARVRTDALIVLQITLSGAGKVTCGNHHTQISVNEAFLGKIPGNYCYFGEDWRFLFIEFSAGMTQWLDQGLTIINLPPSFVHELLTLANTLCSQGEWPLLENAKVAFPLFLTIKEAVITATKPTEALQQIKLYLDTHYFEEISLDDLAERYELSKYQIIRQFEAAYGSSPIRYVKKVRVIQSLPLLWEGRTITEVATAVGFATGNYFSKVFKKEMGVSPSSYQQQKIYYYGSTE